LGQNLVSKPIIALDARLVGTRSTGDATYWRGLIAGLSQLSPEADFLLFSNTVKPEEVPDAPNMRWVHLHSRKSRWWSLFSFPITARRMGAEVIHTQYNLSPLAGRFGITTIHDVSFLIEPSWFKPKDQVLLARFVHPSARRAARVITVSDTSRQDIARFYPDIESKLRVTPLAAGLGLKQMPRAEAEQIVAEELGVSLPYVLTVGTRWPRKNMRLAIEAMEGLSDAFPHRLVITGKSGWEDDFQGERLHATGYVTDAQLSALYTAADLYLAPSRYEGFGITLLEAFQAQCPVICSAGGAHPEVAADSAIVMDSWEPEAWTRAIADVLGNASKLDLLRQKGVVRAAQFNWKATAQATMRVYAEVLGL
jgi:glycosyltransferase involved in cell wall biosynthesis